MAWKPTFKLYQSDSASLQYTFDNIIEIKGWPSDNPDFVELINLRSQGSIIIPGGNKSYEITLRGVLQASNYTALTTAMFALKSAIVNNTRYVLKIDKSNSATDDIKVIRVLPIIFEGPTKRTTWQYFRVVLLANSWA